MGDKMKGLFLAILGVLAAWVVISFFTKDWDTAAPIYLILGIVVGHQIGRQDKGASANGNI